MHFSDSDFRPVYIRGDKDGDESEKPFLQSSLRGNNFGNGVAGAYKHGSGDRIDTADGSSSAADKRRRNGADDVYVRFGVGLQRGARNERGIKTIICIDKVFLGRKNPPKNFVKRL